MLDMSQGLTTALRVGITSGLIYSGEATETQVSCRRSHYQKMPEQELKAAACHQHLIHDQEVITTHTGIKSEERKCYVMKP